MFCSRLCVELRRGLGKIKRLLACATDAASYTLVSDWAGSARSARHLVIHDGTSIDLLGGAAEDFGKVGGPSNACPDRLFRTLRPQQGPFFRQALGPPRSREPCLAQKRDCHVGPTRDFETGGRSVLALQRQRYALPRVLRMSSAAGRQGGTHIARFAPCFGQFGRGPHSFGNSLHEPLSHASPRPCRWDCVNTNAQSHGTVRQQSDILKGNLFTDGCGALRRAGWELVYACKGKARLRCLQAGASGFAARPVFARWRGRRGCHGRILTSDRIILHIDCAGTVKATSAHRKKKLGSGGERAHLEQAFGFPRDRHSGQGQGVRNEDRHTRRESDEVAEFGQRLCQHVRVRKAGTTNACLTCSRWFQVVGPPGSAMGSGSARHAVPLWWQHHGLLAVAQSDGQVEAAMEGQSSDYLEALCS